MEIVNIAGYKFVELNELATLRGPLKTKCVSLGLKGTILLAPEGINLFLAGSPEGIEAILEYLRGAEHFEGAFADLKVKVSRSARQPFRRMLVRQKKEIITMRQGAVRPGRDRAPSVAAAALRRWIERGTDDSGRELVLLDTRNRFEIALGAFEGARHLGIRHFGEFPQAFEQALATNGEDLSDKHVVTYCTGGIRCEKAALFMGQFQVGAVSQLEGGILQYFEEVGGAHWHGECFVFDHRVALDPGLRETATAQCYACRSVVSADEQRDQRYVPGRSCPHCVEVGNSAPQLS